MSAHQTFDTDFTPPQHRTPAEVVKQETNASPHTTDNVASAQETAANLANQAKASMVSDHNATAISRRASTANLNIVIDDRPERFLTDNTSAAANVYNSAVNSQTAQELANGYAQAQTRDWATQLTILIDLPHKTSKRRSTRPATSFQILPTQERSQTTKLPMTLP